MQLINTYFTNRVIIYRILTDALESETFEETFMPGIPGIPTAIFTC